LDAADCAERADFVPGAYVTLVVSDDGGGMSREAIDHIFEPFLTTKDVGQGTGLGLATVYGIVKQNHGFLNVDSEPGKGTIFRIYLPRFVGKQRKRQSQGRRKCPRVEGRPVLLVEDSRSLRVTCGLFLEALGYNVLVAETPAEALSLADQHPGDIHLFYWRARLRPAGRRRASGARGHAIELRGSGLTNSESRSVHHVLAVHVDGSCRSDQHNSLVVK